MLDSITLDEIKEAEELLRGPALEFEPESVRLVRVGNEYQTETKPGWIKLGVAFRGMLKDLQGPPLSIFLAICLHINQKGESWPGVRTLAKETGYNKDTVVKAIDVLENIPGLLEVARRAGKRGTNIYKPAFAAYGKSAPKVIECTDSSDAENVSVRVNDHECPSRGLSVSEKHAQTQDRSRIKKNQEEDLRADARAELRALDQLFTELTGLAIPTGKTDKEKRAEASAWYQPMRRMQALANGRAAEVLRAAVGQMRKDGLTISAPRSVENVFKSLYALKVSPAFVPVKVYE